MNTQPRRTSVDGFTLIEVMLAAAVMLAGIVGMMQVVTSASEMLDASRKQTIATRIMHGEIERVRVTDWSQLELLPETEQIALNSSFQTIGQGFRCVRQIATVKSGMKLVTYTVTWTGNTGRAYSRTSSTYIGKNGLYVAYQR
jgi:Tfp pilus assembly protein PilV